MVFARSSGRVGRPGFRRLLVAVAVVVALAVSGITAAVLMGGKDSENTNLAYAPTRAQDLKKGDHIRAKVRNDHADAPIQACLTIVFFEEDVVGDPDAAPTPTQPDACTDVMEPGDQDLASLTALQDGDHF